MSEIGGRSWCGDLNETMARRYWPEGDAPGGA